MALIDQSRQLEEEFIRKSFAQRRGLFLVATRNAPQAYGALPRSAEKSRLAPPPTTAVDLHHPVAAAAC